MSKKYYKLYNENIIDKNQLSLLHSQYLFLSYLIQLEKTKRCNEGINFS